VPVAALLGIEREDGFPPQFRSERVEKIENGAFDHAPILALLFPLPCQHPAETKGTDAAECGARTNVTKLSPLPLTLNRGAKLMPKSRATMACR